ncbi:caspase, EACC1-associated type [Streptomyces sp. PpalLS-921]|uniref:caspase, EACC1-associated type n=1 Tax=Streptomyces sp. PpalLS-921 TaxID=1839772 RepID=UPI00081E22F5|nr:transporter substrate-binding domain-containing protein [Streptomyces sp. PpalLS-921]SCD80509.1 ABC-type amino acid transport substrate-binding protein [Streptomyces sp. PpalLS-921]
MTRLSAPGTRVLLIGTGTHSAESGLPPVPAVMGTLADLGQALVERCGLAEENLRVIRDPANPTELGIAIAQEAERANDVLWVYYVGHGLVNPAGELYLATVATDSRPGWVAYTALAYTALRGSLLQTAARSIVVVLDCCFSGRAVGVLGSAEEQEVDLARVHGGYVLAAAARDELALATPGAPHTAFTGELIRLLSEGDPEGPQQLTLRQANRYLDRTLPARGFPRPRHRASEWIDDLALCPNPAYRPPTLPPVLSVPAPAPDDGVPQVCPYPGLAAFGPGQAQWFFGREQLITELAERLAGRMDATDPLILVGPSGSGKSSLLGAGLLSALGKGSLPMPGSRTWPHLLLTPTQHPLTELAVRLARLTGEPWKPLRQELEGDPRQLAAAIRELLRARAGRTAITGSRLVLVIDQFEETFTQCADENERRAFIRALCAAAGDGDGEPPALVILSLRSDFRDHCAAFPELRPALHDAPLFIGPMTAPELHEAIAQPAQLTGLTLQPGLIEVLLRDLGADRTVQGHDPEALPLLSHALRATWQRREDRTLTVAGYVAAGGIRNAIDTTAEAVYNEFDPTEQRTAQSLMLRLVHVGEGTQDTRRRASRTRLLHDLPDPDTAATVLENLVRARLVAVETETVEIAHEALLHAWPRFRKWIDDNRAGLNIHQQLAKDADSWDRKSRSPAQLYRGSRLSLAREWATDPARHTRPTSLQHEFLDASTHAVRQRRRKLTLPAAAMCFLLLLTGVTWVLHDLYNPPARNQASEQKGDRKVDGRGTLAIGVSTDQPGMSELRTANTFQGFEPDIALFIAKELGYDRKQVVFVPISPNIRESALRSSQVDLIVSDYGISDTRKVGIKIAGPYYASETSLLLPRESKATNLKDLSGQNVCAVKHSEAEKALKETPPNLKGPQLSIVTDVAHCLDELLARRVDAVASDAVHLAGFANQHPDLRMINSSFGAPEKYGFAMRGDEVALKNAVCDSIANYITSGSWERSYKKFLAPLLLSPPQPPQPPKLTECTS